MPVKKAQEKPGQDEAEHANLAADRREAAAPSPNTENTESAAQPLQAVVGMVASAGGLEAFKQFFQAMPAHSGLAFVLIPHLAPKHESLMAPLLDKQTAMPVVEARDGQRLDADHVYVIPPNHYLTLHQGIIQLSAPPEHGAGQTAIDPFLRSLAADQQERAICIILSGTGSHGSLGLKAVKSEGGMAMVQEPSSAEYDRMPLSAVDTGLADYVLPPGQMPEALIKYVRHFVAGAAALPEPAAAENDLAQVLALLRARTKFDFRAYRKRMLLRRVLRRMGLSHLDRLADYLALLRERPDELAQLGKDLLISVTSFFRDPEMFQVLETQVLPELIEARDADTPVRVWVPGCATGEEAYSIAILLIERIAATGKACPIQIFATDVDEGALEVARRGIYPDALVADLSRQQLERFFTRADTHYWQVSKQLRETVLFAPQNILADAPFSKLDLVSCRNLLIYLEPEVQQKLLQLFHFALNEGGYLILGPSESIGRQTELFRPVSKKWRIFQRAHAMQPSRAGFPVQAGKRPDEQHLALSPVPAPHKNLADLSRKILLEEYAPAAVVINRRYEVLHYSGPTQLYLQQPGGPPSHDLLTLALAALRPRIRAAAVKAINEGARVDIGGIRIKRAGQAVLVRLSVQPLPGKLADDRLLLVIFQDEPEVPQFADAGDERARTDEQLVRQLEYELKTSREELQSTIEELASSNEELKASNEEVMSMNEELQSTNEELETSKEELQSLNEELSTVNAQLRDKVDELENSNDDMTNLLASVDNATLFLGVDRTIQRFTPSATRLFNLIATDVGRPIDHITARFEDPELLRDIDRVLQDLAPSEREVSRDDAQWFLRRITPYRTADNRISGVVLSLTDITQIKRAELELRNMTTHLAQRVSENSAQLQHERNFVDAILNTVGALILVIDTEERVVRFNTACNTTTGHDFAEFMGTTKWQSLIPADEQDGMRRVNDRLRSGEDHIQHENHWLHRDGSMHLISWCNSVLRDEAGRVQYLIGTGIDITEQRRAEYRARETLEEASRLQRLQTANELATLLAHELNQPLAAIATYAETGKQILLHTPADHGKLASNLERISQQSLRAGEAIRHLRAFVGRGRIDPVPTDLNAVVRSTCTLMAPKARARGIDIALDLATLPPVLAVDVHIEQVLLNLLRNAIDAIRDANMSNGSITVTTRRFEDMAQVSVIDSGPGIDAAAADKVFEPLASHKEYGLGVGLRISRSLIEAHGGRLWVEPRTPGGIFHFVLPFAP
ncbi:MAG: CheR family methyltransferase [Thiobacillus sp.]|nr:CheR family methyltransferase [Thiobacillus sp.]MDP2980346.1 CheR family methyltransferase [Thiobacillus sp.]